MELPPRYDACCRAAVDYLTANFRPSKRLWPVNARLAIWLVLEVAIIALVLLAFPHPKLSAKLHEFPFATELAAFLLLGTLAGTLALRNAIPGREASNREIALLCAAGIAAMMLVLLEPVGASVSLGSFVAAGLQCLTCTIALAAIPWIALFWAVRRGVPLAVKVTGGLIGAASFSYAFAASRLGCPIDDLGHILLWHLMPVFLGVALSTLAGISRLRRARREMMV
ncbi:MAG: NrsF family protein [Candidatus Binataceae bacterium]